MPTVSAIDCIQCRVRLENEKIVNGDPTGGCLLQPGWDNHIIWRIAWSKGLTKNPMVHFEIPKKDRQQNVMKNLTGAMYVMNMARK